MCVSVFVYVCGGCVSVQRFMRVRVFDLLTHVFNWNSMQSAYCSTNRICTWWCQPKFFRGFLSVLLRSHTVRQDHLAHCTETPVETRNATIIAPVPLTYICCHYDDNNDYFPFILQFVMCTKHFAQHKYLYLFMVWLAHKLLEIFLLIFYVIFYKLSWLTQIIW